MNKLIGIYGHKGAGKTTIGWLISRYIEELLKGNDISESQYNTWCKEIKENPNIIYEYQYKKVYTTEFREGVLFFISVLLNTSITNLANKKWTNNHWVRMSETKIYDTLPDNAIVLTAKELVQKVFSQKEKFTPAKFDNNIFINVTEFIMYYSYYIMQGMLGENIWMNDLKNSDTDTYKNHEEPVIYFDVKQQSEIDYIKENNGILIKVTRPANYEKDVLCSQVENNTDYSWGIVLDKDNLPNTYSQIKNIATTLIELWYK